MKKTLFLQIALLSSTLFIALPQIIKFDFSNPIPKYHASISLNSTNNKVTWLSINDIDQKLNESPKPILIDFYTNWCGWCKRMDATTFRDEQVVTALENDYYAVKINAESEEVITFNGKTQPMYAFAREMGVSGFPTVILLNTQQKKSKMLVGFQRANTMFKQLNKFVK